MTSRPCCSRSRVDLRLDAHHEGVRRQQARAGAEHDPAPGHVVELNDPVRHVERVVIRKRHHAGPELDVLGSLRRGGDEHLRRVDGLETGRVVLTDPRLLETQLIQPLAELKVPLQGQGRILADRVERGEEHPVAQWDRHAVQTNGARLHR